MKRTRRWLFNLAALISLLLCIATAVEWVLGYRHIGVVSFERPVWLDRDTLDIVNVGFRFVEGHFVVHRTVAHVHLDMPDELVRETRGRTPAWYRNQYRGWIRLDHISNVLTSLPKQGNPWLYPWLAQTNRFGLAVEYRADSRIAIKVKATYIVAPAWLPLAITSVLPAICAIRLLVKRRRMPEGCCAVCGYDLRATPDRCPECGTVSTKVTEVAK